MVNHGSGNWEHDTTLETFATHRPSILFFPLPYGQKMAEEYTDTKINQLSSFFVRGFETRPLLPKIFPRV